MDDSGHLHTDLVFHPRKKSRGRLHSVSRSAGDSVRAGTRAASTREHTPPCLLRSPVPRRLPLSCGGITAGEDICGVGDPTH
jgi:hypothetical protein